MTDLDALTAFVIDQPDDFTGWCAYSDYVREEVRNDEWADLALQFRDADADGRAWLIAQHWQSWPPATGLAMRSTNNALEGMARAGRQLADAFTAVGNQMARAMAPVVEAFTRIHREATEPAAGNPKKPA